MTLEQDYPSQPDSIKTEVPRIDSDQAYEFLFLLRGEHHNSMGIRKNKFTEQETARAKALISEIGQHTDGINTESLTRIMFDSLWVNQFQELKERNLVHLILL